MKNVEVKIEEVEFQQQPQEKKEDDEDELSDEDDVDFILRKEEEKPTNSLSIRNININREDGNILEAEEQNEFSGDNFIPISQFGPKIDVSAFETDIDLLEDKPWRNQDSNISDYFNYGFNEETWRMYCAKVASLRTEYGIFTKIEEKTPKFKSEARSPSKEERYKEDKYTSSRDEKYSKEDKYSDDKYSSSKRRRDSRDRSNSPRGSSDSRHRRGDSRERYKRRRDDERHYDRRY
jgi:hypothetical protein